MFPKTDDIWLFLFSYSKNEFIKPGDAELHEFSYILAEPSSKHSEASQFLQETHEVVEFVDCFNSIGLQYQSMLPVKIKTKPCIWIMRRKKLSAISTEMKERVRQRMLEYKLKQQLESNQTEIIADGGNSDANIEDPQLEADVDLVKIEENDRIRNVLKKSTKVEVDVEIQPAKYRPSAKLKEMIVSHYRSKGRIVEDSFGSGEIPSTTLIENALATPSELTNIPHATSKVSMKLNIKRIIKAEKIKEMVERISNADLQEECDLERMSTKDCLRKLIDEYDEESD